MNLSVGQRLSAERILRDLTVEDVSHKTRMTTRVIRALEKDDLGALASPTYARSFTSMYAEYLEVDVSEDLAQMRADAGPVKSSLNPNLGEMNLLDATHLFASREDSHRHASLPRSSQIGILAILLALVAAIPSVYYAARSNHETTNVDVTEEQIPPRTTASEFGLDPAVRSGSPPLTANTSDSDTVLPARPYSESSSGGAGGERPSFRSHSNETVLAR